jgi:hypothetical protein
MPTLVNFWGGELGSAFGQKWTPKFGLNQQQPNGECHPLMGLSSLTAIVFDDGARNLDYNKCVDTRFTRG